MKEHLVQGLRSYRIDIRQWTLRLLEGFQWQPDNDEEKVAYLKAKEERQNLLVWEERVQPHQEVA
jgi:hypothetical protein